MNNQKTEFTNFLLALAYVIAFFTILLFVIGLIVAFVAGEWSSIWKLTGAGTLIGVAIAVLFLIVGGIGQLIERGYGFHLLMLALGLCACYLYINAEFEPLSEWQNQYLTGNDAPSQWKVGEWTIFKADHPSDAQEYIRDTWEQAKTKHDNNWLRRMFSDNKDN